MWTIGSHCCFFTFDDEEKQTARVRSLPGAGMFRGIAGTLERNAIAMSAVPVQSAVLCLFLLTGCTPSTPRPDLPDPPPAASAMPAHTSAINADDPGFSIIRTCAVASAQKADPALQAALDEVVACVRAAGKGNRHPLTRGTGLEQWIGNAAKNSAGVRTVCGNAAKKIRGNQIALRNDRTYTFGELHKSVTADGQRQVVYQFCGEGLPENATLELTFPR